MKSAGAPSDSMKGKSELPKSALSCSVENLVGTNSEGRNGPLDMECLRAKKGQPSLTLCFATQWITVPSLGVCAVPHCAPRSGFGADRPAHRPCLLH